MRSRPLACFSVSVLLACLAAPARAADTHLHVAIYDWVGSTGARTRRLLTRTEVPVRDGAGLLRISHGPRPNRTKGFEVQFRTPGDGAPIAALKPLGIETQDPLPSTRLDRDETVIRVAPGPDGYRFSDPDDGDDDAAGSEAAPPIGTYDLVLSDEPGPEGSQGL